MPWTPSGHTGNQHGWGVWRQQWAEANHLGVYIALRQSLPSNASQNLVVSTPPPLPLSLGNISSSLS